MSMIFMLSLAYRFLYHLIHRVIHAPYYEPFLHVVIFAIKFSHVSPYEMYFHEALPIKGVCHRYKMRYFITDNYRL
jgi:hypothetical protein